MDLELGGRGALVVGANGGIGEAVCRAYLREGVARLTLAVRSVDSGNALLKQLQQETDASLKVVECDLDDPAAPARCIGQAIDEHGDIDILAMCAGAAPRKSLFEFDAAAWKAWESTIQAKLLGTARLVHAAAPPMLERGWGKFVVVTGMTSRAPKPAGFIGGTVNVALINLVTSLAKEFESKGVSINAVDPAFVRTPRWEKRLDAMKAEGLSDADAVAQVLKGAPGNDMTTPEEIADVVVYLSSDRSSAINGSALHADHAAYPGL